MEGPRHPSGYLEFELPFCAPFTCASHNSTDASLWGCTPLECRRRLQAFTGLLCCLAALTTAFNSVVLATNLTPSTRRLLRRNLTMQNYSNYVVSLSLADLMLGSIVLPLATLLLQSELASMNGPLQNSTVRGPAPPPSPLQTPRTGSERFDEEFAPGWRALEDTDAVAMCLGVSTHLAVFVSMYTLAAASADRLYVSKRPVSSKSIRLSRSSFRRNSLSSDASSFPSCGASRSTVVVVVIWVTGTLFAVAPARFFSTSHFRVVGHVFVAVTFGNNHVLTLLWYAFALALPLAATWLCSLLLCITLRRRKRRLRRRSPAKLETSDHRPTDFEPDSSFALTSRYSNTETPLVGFAPTTDPRTAETDKQIAFKSESPSSSDDLRAGVLLGRAARWRKRPNSWMCEAAGQGITNLSEAPKIMGLLQAAPKKCHSLEAGLSAGYVAKRILWRRSWNGYAAEPETFLNPPLNSPMLGNTTETVKNRAVKSPPSTPSPSIGRRSDLSRYARASSRVRRRSSVYRAREFLRSKSFESNIAKTLFAVVVSFSVATVPLLVALSQVSTEVRTTPERLNCDITVIVITASVLMSNSFWNCVIYGARMPYFRRATGRLVDGALRPMRKLSCAKIMSIRLGAGSLRRDLSERRASRFVTQA